jgi:hypothetical protein
MCTYNGKQCATRNDTPDLRCMKVGCAVIFALKRNEAKRKRNFFRFDAKKSVFFACFALMRNVEIWSETKMKRSENETKKKRNCLHFRFEAKRKRNFLSPTWWRGHWPHCRSSSGSRRIKAPAASPLKKKHPLHIRRRMQCRFTSLRLWEYKDSGKGDKVKVALYKKVPYETFTTL